MILSNVRQAMAPHSRVLIREWRLFRSTALNSLVTTDDYILLAVSRKQAEADAASIGATVVSVPRSRQT